MAPKSAMRAVKKKAEEFTRNEDYVSMLNFFDSELVLRNPTEEESILANEFQFVCLDHFIYSKDVSMLNYLKKMDGFPDTTESQIFSAVLSFYVEGRDISQTRLVDIAESSKDNPRLRMSALVWLLFLNSDTLTPATVAIESSPSSKTTHFQFWDTGDPPEDVRSLMMEWGEALPSGEYFAFDDRSARQMILEEVGTDFAECYDACWHPAMKADLFRLCILYVRGGTYSDADLKVKPDFPGLKATLSERPSFLFRTNKYFGKITNSFMGSPPDNDLVAMCMVELINRMARSNRNSPGRRNSIPYISGPGLITDILIEHLAKGDLAAIPAINAISTGFAARHICSQFNVSYKNDERSWQRWQDSNKVLNP